MTKNYSLMPEGKVDFSITGFNKTDGNDISKLYSHYISYE